MNELPHLSNVNQKYVDNLKNSSNNNRYSQKINLDSKPDTVELSTNKQQKSKKTKAALAFGIIAAAVIAVLGSIYALKKTGKIDKADDIIDKAEDITKNVFKLADVNFSEGVAKLKNGSNFNGTIEDVLKNGDKIKLIYADGVIKSSTREGQKNFEKVFEVINGEKIVTEIKDGVSSKINITEIYKPIKNQYDELNKLLKPENHSDLSYEEFKKQIDEIQYDFKDKKPEIEKILKEKQELKAKTIVEAKAKPEAEVQSGQLSKKPEVEAEYKPIDISKPSEEKALNFGMSLEEMVQEQGLDDLQKKTLMSARDLTLDSDTNLFGDFRKADVFDVPEKMAIAADNSLRQKGSAFICDSTPKLFEGIEESKIESSVTNFLANVGSEKYSSFTIGDKVFRVERISGGEIGTVYKIFDNAGNSVAVKKYRNPLMLGTNCGFQEIATARQATKENVVDIPKFFMANATGYKIAPANSSEYIKQPMWMMSEFISDDAKIPSDGTKLVDWMQQYGLFHCDLNSGAKKGEYIVDLGGIMPNPNNPAVQNRKNWGQYFESALSKTLSFGYFQDALKKLGI